MRALVLLVACSHAAPTIANTAPASAAAAPATEACVRAFVQHDLGTAGQTQVWPVGGYMVFATSWGEAHDCESGCFQSEASGVALSCDRIGWYDMNDYESDHRTHAMFEIGAGDRALFDESQWSEAEQHVSRFVEWIGQGAATPADVKAAAASYLQGHAGGLG